MNSRDDRLVTNKFFEFFLPTILMAAAGSLSIIIDSVIVGNVLGSTELAAMNLVMPLSLCVTTICAFFGVGGSIAISRHKGAMEHTEADIVFTIIVVSWILLSIVSVLAGVFFSKPIAAFFSQGSGLTDYVEQYMKVYIMGSPFSFAMFIFPYIIKADGKPRLCSISLIVSNLVNLCMDVVYMKYLHLGLGGGALATITGYCVGLIICLTYLKSPIRTFHFYKIKLSDFRCYVDMFKYGISSVLGQGLMFVKVLILNMIISNIIGKSGLVAFSVCMSCLSFVSMFIAGASQTMMPLVATFSTCKDETALKITIRKSMKIILGCCIGTTLIFELFPASIMQFYGVTSPEEIAIGITAIRIYSICFIGVGFTFFYMYYMQTIKRTSFSMTICSLEGFVMIVPSAFLLTKVFGLNGIWLSYILTEIVSFTFINIRSKMIVKESNGELYSLFLYRKDVDEVYETTIDLQKEQQIQNAMNGIESFANQKISEEQMNHALICAKEGMSLLEKCRIDAKKISSIVDFTMKMVDEKAVIELKNAGKPLTLMQDENEVIQKLEYIQNNSVSFDQTLLLGMNYMKVIL